MGDFSYLFGSPYVRDRFWGSSTSTLGTKQYSVTYTGTATPVADDITIYSSLTPDGDPVVTCKNADKLNMVNILETISIMKAKLQQHVNDYDYEKLEKIICHITPIVKENIVKAHKRMNMYGKEKPTIASFDEYGNRLPDEIKSLYGMEVKIIDAEENGDYYLAFTGIVKKFDYIHNFGHAKIAEKSEVFSDGYKLGDLYKEFTDE